MWGVNMSKTGAQDYYDSILKLYADWGVDFIKLDDTDLNEKYPYRREEVTAFHKAVEKTGKPIVLSLSLNMKYENREHARANAEMWRVSRDFWDSWEQLEEQFPLAAQWASESGNGRWPDADMLQLGKIAKRGPVGEERFTRFTDDEQLTHMTLWSIARSPLMMGGNMPENTPFTLGLLTNDEVLAVNQRGYDQKQVLNRDGQLIWTSKVPGSDALNVALLNTSDTKKVISVNLTELGLSPKVKTTVRDLWKKQEVGAVSKGVLSYEINPHGAALFRVSPAEGTRTRGMGSSAPKTPTTGQQ
jgi:alpha-galactosidase